VDLRPDARLHRHQRGLPELRSTPPLAPTIGRLLCTLALALALAVPADAADEVPLQPASDADYATFARLTAGALLAWAEGDTEAILAAEDAGLLAWLNRERSLALTLPADRLLPPFAGEPFPCVPLWTTTRVLALRQIPPKVLNDLSVAVLLERALTLSAAMSEGTLAASLAADEALRAELEDDAAAYFRGRASSFLIGEDRAWLSGMAPGALSVAARDAGGRWHVDWRLPLMIEEYALRVAFSPAFRDLPPPAWPAEAYLSLLSEAIPGFPPPEALLRLAESPRPDATQGCWEPFLDPTLMLCPKGEGWAPCVRCESGLCAE
jgi:hypothetical protein